MPQILIDANKYLEFYESTQVNKLIGTLSALSDHVLVTSQLVDEVARNRVSKGQQFLTQSWQKKPLRYSLPLHFVSVKNGNVEELSKRVDDLNNRSIALQRELDGIVVETIRDLAFGRDSISIQLSPILKKAVPATADELERARQRKEIGNPPGKRTDPLGDQITWEQFLAAIAGEFRVWIITGDSDYIYELPDQSLVLNPVLQKDVFAATGMTTEVRCFKTLADGLEDARSLLKLEPAHKLSPDEIAAIRESELENSVRQRSPSVICPACGGATSWQKLRAVQGYMGGIVFFTCPNCGAQFDTE